MPESYQKSNEYKIAFILSDKILVDLDQMIVETLSAVETSCDIKSLRYQVTLSNGDVLKYEDVDSVLKIPNDRTARIVSLDVRTPYRAESSVSLTFRNSITHSSPTISYAATANRSIAHSLASQIDAAVSRSKTYYSKIAYINVVGAILTMLLVITLGLTAVGVIGWLLLPSEELAVIHAQFTWGRFFDQLSVGLLIIGASVAVGKVLERIKSFLYPRAVFAIGDGRKEPQRRAFWRNLIGVSLLLAAGVNIATSLLA